MVTSEKSPTTNKSKAISPKTLALRKEKLIQQITKFCSNIKNPVPSIKYQYKSPKRHYKMTFTISSNPPQK